jgi:hypothetical protein
MLLTTLLISLAGAAEVADNRASISIRFSLYHRYGEGRELDGTPIDATSYKKLGSLKGMLTKLNNGTHAGLIRIKKPGMTIPLDTVLESRERVKTVEFHIKGSQIFQLIQAVLGPQEDDNDLRGDARWVGRGCIDAFYTHTGASIDERRGDYCSVQTLYHFASHASITPADPAGVRLAFIEADGLENKIEITNFGRDRLGPPASRRASSSLLLRVEVGDSEFGEPDNRRGH